MKSEEVCEAKEGSNQIQQTITSEASGVKETQPDKKPLAKPQQPKTLVKDARAGSPSKTQKLSIITSKKSQPVSRQQSKETNSPIKDSTVKSLPAKDSPVKVSAFKESQVKSKLVVQKSAKKPTN